MSKDVLRLSQIIGTFGPGAMVDLPERSVMVSGLDWWEMAGKGAFRVVEERRLVQLLEERLRGDPRIAQDRPLSLRTPPIDLALPGSPPGPGVPVTVFPTWFTCDAVEAPPAAMVGPDDDKVTARGSRRRRRMVQWANLDPPARKRYSDDLGKKHDVTPLRFVCGCENGHLQDIPWRWVVHGDAKCAEPLWLEEAGTSGDPRDTRVVCGCGKALLLEQLFQKGRLGFCRGERPWIGDEDPAGCKDGDTGQQVKLRLLTRSATNAYFPQAATVISLPEADDALGRIIAEHLSDLRDAESAAEVKILRRTQALKAALAGYEDDAVFARIQQLKAGGVAAMAPDPRVAEYEQFAGGRALIGEDSSDALLHASTLPRPAWDPDASTLLAGIEALVAVHRLREVVCLYGFTRFESSPPMSDDGLEDVGLAVRGAALGSNPDWLPAIQQYGEGLFIQLGAEAIEGWLARESTEAHVKRMLAGFHRWEQHKGSVRSRDAVYALLHSLSHALMTEIALDCGYPASALKERVYALPPTTLGGPLRCGLLIYTATAGTQGTLGGLVEVADRFATVLEGALRRLEVCSSDPVCADHDPTAHEDDRATHGAACHGCLLIAETSCEARNLFLDRALLVETMAEPGAAFFRLQPGLPGI